MRASFIAATVPSTRLDTALAVQARVAVLLVVDGEPLFIALFVVITWLARLPSRNGTPCFNRSPKAPIEN